MKEQVSALPIFAFLLSLLFAVNVHAELKPTKRQLIGWIESIQILPDGGVLNAKVDTGADQTSIHAENMEFFEKDGKKWLRFSFIDIAGEKRTLEVRVHGSTSIKRATSKSEKRQVVKLKICVANVSRYVAVSLFDRSKFKFPALIGRDFLDSDFYVDPSSTHRTRPSCKN